MFSQEKLDEDSILIHTGRILDNSNAHEMSDLIGETQQAGHKNIILDMADLTFISSAGVGSILGSVGASREMGGDIIMCNVPDSIRHIFEILDLCGYLTITSDKQAARELCTTEG
jgi:anti-anti-sigma factor